jgi:TfoX/Sxy family transcriptional regulator of competence genes
MLSGRATNLAKLGPPLGAGPVRLIDCGSTATVLCHPRNPYAEMTYDNEFAHRIREQLADERGVTEKAMFGGLAFLLDGNMAVGISNSGELMVRVGPDASDEALARAHTRIFDMTGRPMKGWILVAAEGFATKRQLGAWVRRGMAFARTLPAKG